MHRECRERFPRHWLQRKRLVSDPSIHHGTCVTHVLWCLLGLTFRPPCDIIGDVIIMKKLFMAQFGTIFSYLKSNWSCVRYFKIFKMGAILSSRQNFSPEVIPEVEYTRKIAISISDILSFWSTIWLKHWRRYINFTISPALWPGPRLNIKTVLSTYGDFHVKDKTAVRTSYL